MTTYEYEPFQKGWNKWIQDVFMTNSPYLETYSHLVISQDVANIMIAELISFCSSNLSSLILPQFMNVNISHENKVMSSATLIFIIGSSLNSLVENGLLPSYNANEYFQRVKDYIFTASQSEI